MFSYHFHFNVLPTFHALHESAGVSYEATKRTFEQRRRDARARCFDDDPLRSRVAQTFFVDEDIQKLYSLDCIVTVCDAKHLIMRLDDEKPEGVENEAVEQLAFADRVLLNKIDLVPDEKDLALIEARIRTINAEVPILRCTKSQVDWKAMGVELVIDCTGKFLKTEALRPYLDVCGVKRVVTRQGCARECGFVPLPPLCVRATVYIRWHYYCDTYHKTVRGAALRRCGKR